MRALRAGLVSLAICGCLLGGVSPSVASVPRPASSQPVVTAIAVDSNPAGIAVDSAADLVYVANQGSDSVSVVDGTSNKVVATIKLPAGAGPTDLAFDPTTKLIYVVEQPLHTVQVIDATTDALGTAIDVSSTSTPPWPASCRAA